MQRILKIRSRTGLTTIATTVMIGAFGVLAVGSWALLSGNARRNNAESSDLYLVTRGSFDILIPASGELVAQNQIEIKNKIESRSTIAEIVDEGSFVEKGQVVVKFNDEEISNRVRDSEESVISAQNKLDSAQEELVIKKKTQESELEKAQLKIELADLTLKEWQDGEDVTKRLDLRLALQTAKMNYNRIKEKFEASTRLFEQDFISYDEYKRDEISLVEAEANLEKTELDIKVYKNYTFEKDRKQKESDLYQSQKEQVRITARQKAEVSRAESDVFSQQRQLKSKQDRLKKLREQLEFCTIIAPQDGLVVYASSMNAFRWMSQSGRGIQVGTELWHNQLIMVLPDTSQMVAEVKVNEALSGTVKPGQKATVTCDAFPDDILTGVVDSISVLAESGNWTNPNLREYTVRIKLDDVGDNPLKPSMRCQADLQVDRIEDSLYIPIQAVFREAANIFVYVPQGSGFAQKKVTIGQASELFVEVLEGLSEGDEVLVREPKADEIVSTLPPDEETKDPDEDSADDNVEDAGDAVASEPETTEAPAETVETPTDTEKPAVSPDKESETTTPPPPLETQSPGAATSSPGN